MSKLFKLTGCATLLALVTLAACDYAGDPSSADLTADPASEHALPGLEPAMLAFSDAVQDLTPEAMAEEAEALLDAAVRQHVAGGEDARFGGQFTLNLCAEGAVTGDLKKVYPEDFVTYTVDLQGGTGDLTVNLELLDPAVAGLQVCIPGRGCRRVLGQNGTASITVPDVPSPTRATVAVAFVSPPDAHDVRYRLRASFSGPACFPPPPPCVRCGISGNETKADKVSELTLRYRGTAPALVEVYNAKDNANPQNLLFRGTLSPNQQFTIRASDVGASELAKETSFYINGVKNFQLHLSCSRPVGPGLEFGQFVIVSGKDKQGRPLCPIPSGGCNCRGGVQELRLRYQGTSSAPVQVYNRKTASPSDLIFSGTLAPNEAFTIRSSDIGLEKFNNDISFYVSGTKDAEMHVSCSQPIGPGLVRGRFLVLSGKDKEGSTLCPVGS